MSEPNRTTARGWKWGLLALTVAVFVAVYLAGRRPAPGNAGAAGEHVVHLTDGNFAEKTSGGVVLVDFWATWCPPCRQQGPIVSAVARQYAGRVVVGKLDVDENRRTAERFEVRNIPTLIVLRDGQVFRRMVGLRGREELSQALEAALAAT